MKNKKTITPLILVVFFIVRGEVLASVIQDEELQNFIESDVSDSFSLSIDDIAEKTKNYGRFRAWLNSDVGRIKEVLRAVEGEGVSPAFFASYEKTEGYNNSWGWLNHTRQQGSYLEDAQSVARWIVNQSNNMTDRPAWVDVGNPVDFVPSNVKEQGNNHFKSIPRGSIGRVVITGTAAATWEVYYPKGLLKEYNKVQNYGKPLTNMMITIKEWGGSGTGASRPCFPTSPESIVTSNWGWRILNGVRDFHAGTDYASPNGGSQPIYATQAGVVLQSGMFGSGGYTVTIQHSGDPYYSRYMHMVRQPDVKVGDIVEKCQKIGDTGNTGNSYGIHLHFEIAPSLSEFGKSGNTLDAEEYLKMSFGGDTGTIGAGYKAWCYLRQTNMRRMGVRGRR